MRKIAIFGQISWTNTFGKFRFCGRFEKFFLSRISKNVLFRLDLPKELSEKNDHFLPKCMDYPLWKIFIFLDLFKTWLFSCRNDFFLFRISKNVLSSLDLAKNHHWEKWLFFGQKPWTNPFGKFSISWTFLKVDF